MIKFEDVQKVYPNGTVALKDINLEIQQGEFVANYRSFRCRKINPYSLH